MIKRKRNTQSAEPNKKPRKALTLEIKKEVFKLNGRRENACTV
jgi:hypothetical protein